MHKAFKSLFLMFNQIIVTYCYLSTDQIYC